MRVPVRAGVAGRYRISELHPDTLKPITGRGGVPIIRDESGFVRPVGGWHRNLITNAGLDSMASQDIFEVSSGSGIAASMRRYMVVGSDATTPDPTDTQLGSELGRTDSAGGFSRSQQRGDDDGNGNCFMRQTLTRVYTAPSAQIIREIGFSRAAQSNQGPVNIRFIPEDEGGSPISVSLGEGKKLRVDHELMLTTPREQTDVELDIVEYDAGGSPTTTRSFTASVWAYMADTWEFNFSDFGEVTFGTADLTERPAPNASGYFTNTGALGTNAKGTRSGLGGSYTPGSFTLTRGGGITEAQLIGAAIKCAMIGWHNISQLRIGWIVAFQGEDTQPKDSFHTLDLYAELTWGRAE